VRIACFVSHFDIDLCIFAVLYMFGLVDCAITISGPDLWTRGGEGAIPVIDNKVLYYACTVFFIAHLRLLRHPCRARFMPKRPRLRAPATFLQGKQVKRKEGQFFTLGTEPSFDLL